MPPVLLESLCFCGGRSLETQKAALYRTAFCVLGLSVTTFPPPASGTKVQNPAQFFIIAQNRENA